MTLKELMMGNIQGQNTALMQLGAQASRKGTVSGGGTSEFGDILGSRMSSKEKQTVGKKDYTPVANADSKSESRAASAKENIRMYKTYREAAANDAKDSASEVVENQGTKSTGTSRNTKGTEEKRDKAEGSGKDGKSKSEAAQDNSGSNMIQAMAQVLGLYMGELQKLLREAGITSESFNNGKDISENVSKLSQVLGLTAEQQDTLAKLLELTGQAMTASEDAKPIVSEGMTEETSAKEQMKADEAGKVIEVIGRKISETVEESNSTKLKSEMDAMLAKLDRKIKEKLNEFGSKLENSQDAVKSELAELLRPLTGNAGEKIQETAPGTNDDMTSVSAAKPDTAATEQAENTSGKDDRQEENGTGTRKDATVPQLQTASEPVRETSQAAFAAVQDNRIQNTEPVQKGLPTKTPTDAKEIMSQVIEKAKVILTADKSEMMMDLKPESLGKLSLKVVTENGIVMAKFVAENQQVKQVLESNMQLLKDSLERQGMNVQGFSVSVRQDSNRSAEQWSGREDNRSRNNGNAMYRVSGVEGSLATSGNTAAKNPYTWGASTINLTA